MNGSLFYVGCVKGSSFFVKGFQQENERMEKKWLVGVSLHQHQALNNKKRERKRNIFYWTGAHKNERTNSAQTANKFILKQRLSYN